MDTSNAKHLWLEGEKINTNTLSHIYGSVQTPRKSHVHGPNSQPTRKCHLSVISIESNQRKKNTITVLPNRRQLQLESSK